MAVSGGQDSVALLHLLTRIQRSYNLFLAVAHLNHCLRPSSDEEEVYVKALAGSFGLPFVSGKKDVDAIASKKKESLETVARSVRRDFLQTQAVEMGCDKVALGHTSDDQAETLLMKLIRGAGGRGLSGMAYQCPLSKEVNLIRPILDLSRNDTEAYCHQNHLEFVSDESNDDERFFRNWVRHTLLPTLSEKNPGIQTSLNRLSQNLSDDEMALLWALEVAISKLNPRFLDEGGLVMNKAAFVSCPLALQKRILERLIQQNWGAALNLSREKMDQVFQVLESAGEKRISLTSAHELLLGYDRILIRVATKPDSFMADEQYVLSVPGTLELPPFSASVQTEVLNRPELDSIEIDGPQEETLYLPLKFMKEEIIFRSRREGDRLYGRKKKVKEFMIEKKISRAARDRLPMLASGENEILWIPGYFRARVMDSSQPQNAVIRIRFIGNTIAQE